MEIVNGSNPDEEPPPPRLTSSSDPTARRFSPNQKLALLPLLLLLLALALNAQVGLKSAIRLPFPLPWKDSAELEPLPRELELSLR